MKQIACAIYFIIKCVGVKGQSSQKNINFLLKKMSMLKTQIVLIKFSNI